MVSVVDLLKNIVGAGLSVIGMVVLMVTSCYGMVYA
jgi:hypothetical protein